MGDDLEVDQDLCLVYKKDHLDFFYNTLNMLVFWTQTAPPSGCPTISIKGISDTITIATVIIRMDITPSIADFLIWISLASTSLVNWVCCTVLWTIWIVCTLCLTMRCTTLVCLSNLCLTIIWTIWIRFIY